MHLMLGHFCLEYDSYLVEHFVDPNRLVDKRQEIEHSALVGRHIDFDLVHSVGQLGRRLPDNLLDIVVELDSFLVEIVAIGRHMVALHLALHSHLKRTNNIFVC